MSQVTTGKFIEFSDFQWAKSGGETQTTATTWQSKLSKTFKRVQTGSYQITWTCQIYCISGNNNKCEVQFRKDATKFGSGISQAGVTIGQQVSGVLYESYTAGQQPVLELQFRRDGGSNGNTVAIKRAAIGIVRVGD